VASTEVLHPVGVRDESPFAVGLPEMVPTVKGEWIFYVRGLKENVCLG